MTTMTTTTTGRPATTASNTRPLRVLIVTTLFPNRVRPGWAPFNRQQFAALGRLPGVHVVDVLATVPWFPLIDRLAPRSSAAGLGGVPSCEEIDGLSVRHPRTAFLPRIGHRVASRLFAASLARCVAEYRGRVDVVLAAWAHPDGCAAVALGRLLNVPVVVKVHGSDVNAGAQLRGPRAVLRRMLPRATRVVTVSAALGRAVAALGVDPTRIDVVRNGVDRALFRPQERDGARRTLGLGAPRVVVCPGRIERGKGVFDLLDAFVRVHAALPDTQLVFVGGGGALAELRSAAERLGLGQAVLPTGPVPLDAMPLWLAAADVVAMPSWAEGLPNTVLEAHACGRPVIATAVGGVGEVIAQPFLGTLVPPRDPGALAQALIEGLSRAWDEGQIADAAAGDWTQSARALGASLHRAHEENPGTTARHARRWQTLRALCFGAMIAVSIALGSVAAPRAARADEGCRGRYRVAPTGDDRSDGSAARPFRTIQRAADVVDAGETVCVAAGRYRERVVVGTSGKEGAPVTFEGESGAIVDGGEAHGDGWESASEFGRDARGRSTVWKKRIVFAEGATPYHGTLDGRYVLRLRDRGNDGRPFMADCGSAPRTCTGGDRLRNGPRGSNAADGRSEVLQGWEHPGVIEAMFGVADGWTYVAFADGGSPNGRALSFSPKSGASFTVTAAWVVVRGFELRGANYPVYLPDARAHHVTVEDNTVRNGFFGVFLAGGAHHNLVRRNDVSIEFGASLDPADPWHWFIWNAFRNNSELHRASISMSGGGDGNEIADNDIHDAFGGIDEDGSTPAGAGVLVHHNEIRTCANDGLTITGGKESFWVANVVVGANVGTRFWPRGANASVHYSGNDIRQPARGGEACLFFFRGSTSDALDVSRNRCTGRVGLLFGSTNVAAGLPGLDLRDNVFDVATVVELNDWPGWMRVFASPATSPRIAGLHTKAPIPAWLGVRGLFGPVVR